jgi:class 3 adenylate cyclase/tetratricopeptide (TPR) repeat protein
MPVTCQVCGATLAEGSRFCHACGAALDPESADRFATPRGYTPAHLVNRILSHRNALEGEHKRVTVMFCDLEGSTALAQRVGPEVMHDVLDRFFEAALDAVHRYEGTVNQFLGDGFMALFGAPLAIEHHERQALLAALALRDGLAGRLRDVERRIGEPLRVRTGLNTGDVVVGKIGDNLRMDYTAVGDTTNVAARLQHLASPGTIVVSDVTYERVRSFFTAQPLGLRDLAGRSTPVMVYQICSRLPSRSTVEGAEVERTLSPFVGRAAAQAALHEAVAEAEAGRGQIVGIMGDAGLGKSRLLAELRRGLADHRLTWLEGRCLPYGVAIPYLPILDFLRANARIVDTDTPETIGEKVRATLLEVGLDAPDAGPLLLTLLGVKEWAPLGEGTGPEATKGRTFEVLRELAVRGSRRRPIVFVVEDLHWIDQASLDFLMDLADTVAGSAILCLATYRPGFAPPWAAKSYATQIALRPLGAEESLAVIEAAAGVERVTAEGRRAVAARGEGNPFFLEELVRALLHETPAPPTAIPETLHGLLMSRIDRLPDETKRTLQIAAVIGREFSARLLARVSPAAAGLEERLRELTRREFLRLHTRGEAVYVFNHALTRDVVYGSLLDRHRRQYHAAVGRALLSEHEGRLEEVVEVLAYHFGAGDADEPAVDFAMRAAAKAQRRWANVEALTHADVALRRLATMDDTPANRRRRIDTVIQQAEVRFALGQHVEHVGALEGIGPDVAADGDPGRRAAWHYWVGFLDSLTGGRPETAIAHCREAVAIAETEGLEEIGAHADACLAQAHHVAGELAPALAAGERALAVFDRRANTWWACRALAQLSAIANSRGDWARSVACCRRIQDSGEALDDVRLKASALVRLASTYIQQGDWQTGLPYAEQALAVKSTPYDAAAVQAIRGYGLVKAGRVADGVAELKAAVAWYERSSLRYTHAQFSLWLAEAYLRLGDRPRCRAIAEQVRNIGIDLGYGILEAVADRLHAETATGSAISAALTGLERAERVLERAGALSELARAWLAHARLAEAAGLGPDAAGPWEVRARELFTDLRMQGEDIA